MANLNPRARTTITKTQLGVMITMRPKCSPCPLPTDLLAKRVTDSRRPLRLA